MAFIAFPSGCVEIVIRFIWNGHIVSITLGACNPGGVNEASMDDLDDALEDWLTNDLMPSLSTAIEAVAIRITDLSSESGMSKEYPISITGSGGAGDTVQNSTTAAITFGTASRGRSYRGRNYIPGLPNSTLDDPVTITSAAVTAYLAVYTALATAMDSMSFSHVVLSRYNGGAPRGTGVATQVTFYAMDIGLDVQRRRTRHGILG